jgi:Acyl-CoA thioester hydrolase/BAAT N-terminal region
MSTAIRFRIRAGIFAALTILCLVPWMGTSRLIAASEVSALQVVVGKSVRLELSPAQVLEGDPVTLRVTGVRPGAVVTIHIQSISLDDAGQKEPFYGEATFMADASGTINLATAPPVRGYYQGADIHGLFWSQSPLAANSGQAAITALHLDDPSSVSAHQAVLTLEEGGTVQDRRVLTFVSNDPDVMREDVRSDGVIGVFYSKRSARKRPVVVALTLTTFSVRRAT